MIQLSLKSKFYQKIFQLHQEMQANGFSLIYEGEITHQITKAFTSLTEKNMDREFDNANVKKKVFHIMVESLQNICKHSDDEEYADSFIVGKGFFIVGANVDEYNIITGNKMLNTKREWMETTLDKINSMDKEGLKELHKQAMRDGSISEKGGAGLGFIDIARKSSGKLAYHIEQINNTHSYFLLQTKVSRNS